MKPADDWDEILRRCLLSHDARDWEALIVRMVPIVRRICFHSGVSPEDVEDFGQQLLVRLCEDDCRRLRLFDETRGVPFPAYLRVIAERLWISWLRSRGRSLGNRVDLATLAEVLETPPDIWQRLKLRELHDSVAALPPGQRVPMKLLLNGLTIQEIAETLGISANAVRLRLFHGRESLRGLLHCDEI